MKTMKPEDDITRPPPGTYLEIGTAGVVIDTKQHGDRIACAWDFVKRTRSEGAEAARDRIRAEGRAAEREDVVEFMRGAPGRIPDAARASIAGLADALMAGTHVGWQRENRAGIHAATLAKQLATARAEGSAAERERLAAEHDVRGAQFAVLGKEGLAKFFGNEAKWLRAGGEEPVIDEQAPAPITGVMVNTCGGWTFCAWFSDEKEAWRYGAAQIEARVQQNGKCLGHKDGDRFWFACDGGGPCAP